MASPSVHANGKSVVGILNEMKFELRDFVDTRLEMLKSELRDKFKAIKMALPMLIVGAIFAAVGFLLLTGALVAAIAYAIGVGWSLLAVGILYLIIASVAGWLGYREFSAEGIVPKRTLKVLKQDQAWLQSEARTI